jgi:uncharacterized protein YggU (UPF0235/DUF167 family)
MRHRLAVRVQPGGSADRIEGRGTDDAGRVFLKVRVVTGGKTRLKGLEIEGPPDLAGMIEGWLADERSTD